ncbi:MAG TPA: hypothetical protein VGM17_19035 [Rhizomicrobium sp.]|jgi:hypothetical protein
MIRLPEGAGGMDEGVSGQPDSGARASDARGFQGRGSGDTAGAATPSGKPEFARVSHG